MAKFNEKIEKFKNKIFQEKINFPKNNSGKSDLIHTIFNYLKELWKKVLSLKDLDIQSQNNFILEYKLTEVIKTIRENLGNQLEKQTKIPCDENNINVLKNFYVKLYKDSIAEFESICQIYEKDKVSNYEVELKLQLRPLLYPYCKQLLDTIL